MLDTIENVEESLDVDIEFRELNRYVDRCDKGRCSAQAFILAVHNVSKAELTFCGHHGKQMIPSLIAQGFMISDETHKINEKPSISASNDED